MREEMVSLSVRSFFVHRVVEMEYAAGMHTKNVAVRHLVGCSA
jgi:hypothetical protein